MKNILALLKTIGAVGCLRHTIYQQLLKVKNKKSKKTL